jgi:hypothetical protein
MHKTHFMSQANVTIPITVKHSERPGRLRAVSFEELKNSETAEFRFIEDKSLSRFGPFDPWQLRKDFLSWPLDGWEGFIAMAGDFGTFRISKRIFGQWQSLLREAMIRPAREWVALKSEFQKSHVRLSLQPRIAFDWGGETPKAIIFAQTALEAIIATIQIDKLIGAEFRVCARHDCKNPPFRVEARHKIFCLPDCAHLVAVRRSRERAANGKNKLAKKASSKKRRGLENQ